ncbi:MAG: hypothetical protein OXP07_02275, partial [Defluviicoccus sp.]|nr:hypothetical protein [Defluviicoccus sp.]
MTARRSIDESETGSVPMTGTLPQGERNGQPRNHLTPHDGRQKTSPVLGGVLLDRGAWTAVSHL